MGNTLSIDGCCAPDRSSLKRSKGKAIKTAPDCYGPAPFEGAIISVAYTEWEEIIALSRAITPGGKLLGLSSTKKMLCTLHKTHAPMILPGFGTAAQHFYSIKVWEVNRAVGGVDKLRSQLSNSSSKKTTSNHSKSEGGSPSTEPAPKATTVRTNNDLTSQYIRPYCKTRVHYW